MKEFLKDSKFTLILLTVLTAIFFFNKKKEKKTGNEVTEKKETGNEVTEKKDSIFIGGALMPQAEYPLRPYSQVGEYSEKLGSRGPQITALTIICQSLYGTKFSGNAGDYTPEKEAAFLKYFGKTVFDENDYLEIRKQELLTEKYWWARAI